VAWWRDFCGWPGYPLGDRSVWVFLLLDCEVAIGHGSDYFIVVGVAVY